MLINKLVFFTGAGFSKNFGGFLGVEMWSKIFNHPSIQQSPKLRSLMLSTFEYENAYSEVIDSADYTEDEQKIMQKVVEDSYDSLHFALNNPIPSALTLDSYKLADLIKLQEGEPSSEKYFFTLNQDLLLERIWNYCSFASTPFDSQGISTKSPLARNRYVTLPTTEELLIKQQQWKNYNATRYVKLHGSYGWLSHTGESRMILGVNKTSKIKEEPLLSYYLDLFQQVLSSGGVRLVIVGYGFRDEHINKILLEGVQSHNLQLYIIQPVPAKEFYNWLRSPDAPTHIIQIWSGVKGYFPYSLVDIFPPNQSGSQMIEEIKKALKN